MFKIEFHPPIEGASKLIIPGGETYDPENTEHYSEWTYAIALRNFEIGSEVTEDDLIDALEASKLQQVLDGLIEKGYVSMSWDGDEPVYFLTDKGNEYAEN